MNFLKKALIGTSFGAIVAVMGSGAAMATPAFVVDPTSINGTGQIFTATDFTYSSVATVIQTAPGQQTETGFAYLTGFKNNNAAIGSIKTGMQAPAEYTQAGGYGLYFTFTATVSGVDGFGGNNVGIVDSFTIDLYADKNEDTTFLHDPSDFSPSVVGGTTGDDIHLAHGTLVSGSAGFQGATGAPTFSAVDFFSLIGAGSAYFIGPDPFYNLVLTSTTGGSFQNVTPNCATPATCTAATIGIDGSANFVPEPLTLSVFGAGLFGAAALRRRRKAKKA
jgi:hypothetical protein